MYIELTEELDNRVVEHIKKRVENVRKESEEVEIMLIGGGFQNKILLNRIEKIKGIKIISNDTTNIVSQGASIYALKKENEGEEVMKKITHYNIGI